MPRTFQALLASLTLLLAANGCTSAADSAIWQLQRSDSLSTAQQTQLGRATAARNALFSGLLEALGGSLAQHGPAGSIDVCRSEAPRLAADVAREHGVRIGRTSHRLRNPDNAPPEWAVPVVAAQEPQQSLACSSTGELGVLMPIVLAEACLACHGAADQLAPGVAEALARGYPDDQATGFAVGELRGWFWVEVPPVSR